MMQIFYLVLLCLFYIVYFIKMLILKKQGISVDLLGKGSKSKKSAQIEIVLKSIAWLGAMIQFANPVRVTGLLFGTVSVILFILSVSYMRTNWRAGFDREQKTSLVTDGNILSTKAKSGGIYDNKTYFRIGKG